MTLRAQIRDSWKEVGVGQQKKATEKGKYSPMPQRRGSGTVSETRKSGRVGKAKAGRKRNGAREMWGRHGQEN